MITAKDISEYFKERGINILTLDTSIIVKQNLVDIMAGELEVSSLTKQFLMETFGDLYNKNIKGNNV